MNYLLLLLVLTTFVTISLEQRRNGCITPRLTNGICQPLTSCNELNRMIQARPLLENVTNYLSSSQCDGTGQVPNVCCPTTNATLVRYLSAKIKLLPDLEVCGKSSGGVRIVGGSEVDLAEHPWMALLQYSRENKISHLCGGVIISEFYVLTAAHCVQNPELQANWKLIGVRLGEHDTRTNPDCSDEGCNSPYVEIPIESSVVHPQFNSAAVNQQHDIALLRLVSSIEYTEYVRPVCLPVRNPELMYNDFSEYSPYIVGWGKTERESLSEIKLQVRLPVVSFQSCNEKYKTSNVRLTRKQLCAGGQKGKDACRGDSGGPLLIPTIQGKSDNWFAIGIASFGPNPCGSEGWPGVYTTIGPYTNWILQNINP